MLVSTFCWQLVQKVAVKVALHYQLDRRKSAKQNIYDGRKNFHDGSVNIV